MPWIWDARLCYFRRLSLLEYPLLISVWKKYMASLNLYTNALSMLPGMYHCWVTRWGTRIIDIAFANSIFNKSSFQQCVFFLRLCLNAILAFIYSYMIKMIITESFMNSWSLYFEFGIALYRKMFIFWDTKQSSLIIINLNIRCIFCT